jgi:hypothetical protein
VIASAIAGEYGPGINFVATQSLGVYLQAQGLILLTGGGALRLRRRGQSLTHVSLNVPLE